MEERNEPGPHVELDGNYLTRKEVVAISHGNCQVVLTEDARDRVLKARVALERAIKIGKPMYGVNTGVGSNKGEVLSPEQLVAYQSYYIMAHACGVGEPLPKEIVRAMMAVRVNSFARGNSGVTLRLCEAILDLLNNDIIPVIPSVGSVGASGDLVPLAHLGAVLIGLPETQVFFGHGISWASAILAKAGLRPITLQAKEAMALTNGAAMILAYASLAAAQMENLFKAALAAAALSLEAIRGEQDAFDARIQEARGQFGQRKVAAFIRKLLKDSRRTTEAARQIHLPDDQARKGDHHPRVQDAYSFRCIPQVHGAHLDAMSFATNVFNLELNASTDNPLVFVDEADEVGVLSGGNFHAEPLTLPLEILSQAVAKAMLISDRRIFSLLSSKLSYGLPQDLSGSAENGHTGLMIAQYMTAACANRVGLLASNAAKLNVPTSDSQEDYVSMGATSAWKLWEALDLWVPVIATELFAAYQGVCLSAEALGEHSKLGEGTQEIFNLLCSQVPVMREDRYIKADIDCIAEMVRSGAITRAVEGFWV